MIEDEYCFLEQSCDHATNAHHSIIYFYFHFHFHFQFMYKVDSARPTRVPKQTTHTRRRMRNQQAHQRESSF
jgi:hypothetical protein